MNWKLVVLSVGLLLATSAAAIGAVPENHGNVPPNWLAGSITADRVLTAAEPGPAYIVYGDLTVEAAAHLTIEPGVTLTFPNNSDFLASGLFPDKGELIVYGHLLANGGSQGITIHSDLLTSGSWGGIIVKQDGSATLDHLTIDGAVYGLDVTLGTVTITNSHVFHTSMFGIVSNGVLNVSDVDIQLANTGLSASGEVALTRVSVVSAKNGILVSEATGTLRECTAIGYGGNTGLALGPSIATTPSDSTRVVPSRASFWFIGVVVANATARNVIADHNTRGFSCQGTSQLEYCTSANNEWGIEMYNGTVIGCVVTKTLYAVIGYAPVHVAYSDLWHNSFMRDGNVVFDNLIAAFDPYYGVDYRLSPASLFADFGPGGGMIGAYGPGPLGGPTEIAGASVVAASATFGVARVRWYVSGSRGSVASVFRREGEDEWMAIGEVEGDGSGYAEYEDRNVKAGVRYGYGLGVVTPDGVAIQGEAWVNVPVAEALKLYGARPNPAKSGAMRIGFALGDDSPATLELLDVSGRRLVSHGIAGLGAGEHEVSLGERQALRPGAYWVRLIQAGRSRVARVCVVE